MIGDRVRLVLAAVAAILVLVGLVFGGRWVIGWIRGGETKPAATEVAQVQLPSPTPTEWGAELFPTSTPTPTATPTPTSTPVLTGVDAFGFPPGYQPEGAAAEEIPDIKKIAPPETPTAPGVEVTIGEQKPGLIEQIPGLAERMKEAGGKASEFWQGIAGPTPTPTPPPKGGIAGTGIPLWAVILVVIVVVVVILALRFVEFSYE
ncbi:MAG: hypothetical protein FJ044_00905 [Candidatus Cloacimonetes bacterium]|nr:hypothetical protein [Candidatus Cloacimonadota bacterium]